MFRIKMQHDACDFAPVSTFRIRVEQAQIRDEVLLVVNGQYGIGGRGIGDIGIKRRLLHGLSSRSESFALSERQTTIGALLVASHFPFAFSQAFPTTRLALYSGSVAYS